MPNVVLFKNKEVSVTDLFISKKTLQTFYSLTNLAQMRTKILHQTSEMFNKPY